MRYIKYQLPLLRKYFFATFFLLISGISSGQQEKERKISLGIHADPAVSWFSSDVKEVESDGARPGFCFGLVFNRYFTHNYSFSTGISLLNAGGRVVSSSETIMSFPNTTHTVLADKPVTYKIQYLVIPIGLKLQTNQIGYISYFTDLGLDPKIVLNGKVDIPSLDLKGENASEELKMFNMGYHITGGIEYSLGGSTAIILGLNFDNNFLDITKDNGVQPKDKLSQKIISFKFGVNF